MTLEQQLTELKKKFHESEQVDGAILMRVLDSIVLSLDEQRIMANRIEMKLDAKADKVPYTGPR